MTIKGKLNTHLNQLSLKTQLTALITITVTVIIIIIIAFNYRRSIDAITSQKISTYTTLLGLETQNLDSYLTEIDRYSLLLRNDPETLRNLTTKKPLSYSQLSDLQTQVKSNFYSRNDLLSYRLFLVNQTENFEITTNNQKIRIFYNDSLKYLPEYKLFTKGKYYKYIKPTEDVDSFFIYYRTIINIEDQNPLAVVELTFDTSYIDSLVQNHSSTEEIMCMIDSQGQLLYSNNNAIATAPVCESLNKQMNETKLNHFLTEFDDTKYLVIYNKSADHDYSIMILNSLELIDYQVNETRNISILLGFISITVSAALAILFINLVTQPLSKLSRRFIKVGKGNFTTTVNIEGSREIALLAESFNDMIHQIDELITKNYVSEINEKTARLAALEAQINPHFLYNTLQAISAEAIVNHQPQINSMITSLASMLRYSIKGGDMVTLGDEMKHVQDYLLLQHARFGSALTYEIAVSPDTLDLLIPKISVQVLVENAIIHGMGGNKTSLHIKIESIIVDNTICITVIDNGNGITKEQQDAINASFTREQSKKAVNSSIGLSNLYSRLQILYGDNAKLNINSIPNEITTVSFCITMLGEEDHV